MKVELINTFQGGEDSFYCIEKNEKGGFYTGGKGNHILEWDMGDPERVKAISRLPHKAFSLLYNESLSHLLIGQSSGGIHVIDLNEKKEIRLLQGHDGIIYKLVYIPLKNIIVACSGDGHFSIWDASSYEMIAKHFLSEGNCRSIAHYENYLFIGSGVGIIYKYNIQNKEITNSVSACDNTITSLTIDQENQLLISGSKDAHIRYFDLDLKINNSIPAHNYAIYGLTFNPEFPIYASSSMDKTIKIWQTGSSKPILRIDKKDYDGHTSSVNGLLWMSSEDLISYGDDKTIKHWKITLNNES
jgi:WD40 repeat protein